jgi:hypothetical protein
VGEEVRAPPPLTSIHLLLRPAACRTAARAHAQRAARSFDHFDEALISIDLTHGARRLLVRERFQLLLRCASLSLSLSLLLTCARRCPFADVSGVFNWSVKQLFLWVSVEYWDPECGTKLAKSCEGGHCAELADKGCHQEVVIWDKIITRDSPHTDRMKITPESRRECPNPRTPYCHYYYNLKEDRQIEMRDKETTIKVAWSVMPTCGQIWEGSGELYKSFTLPDTASKPFDFYNFRGSY